MGVTGSDMMSASYDVRLAREEYEANPSVAAADKVESATAALDHLMQQSIRDMNDELEASKNAGYGS